MGALSVEAFLEEKSGCTIGVSISRRKKLGAISVEAFLEEKSGCTSTGSISRRKQSVHFQWKHF